MGVYVSAPLARNEPIDIHAVIALTELSGREFAALLGTNYSAVSAWKAGKTQPTGATRTLLLLLQRSPDVIMPMLQALHPNRWKLFRNSAPEV